MNHVVQILMLALPVLLFLAALVYLDSFKLLALRWVVLLVLLGACSAGAAFLANTHVSGRLEMEFTTFSRWVAPWIEETLKAFILLIPLRTRRLGLAVDGAIAGFAIGAGFALAENAFYLLTREALPPAAVFMRGFSTAVMHGGATAVFSMVAVTLADRARHGAWWPLVPALLAAVALHAAYNSLLAWPLAALALIIGALPLVFHWVFAASEQELRHWLESGLDANMELLTMINRGEVLSSPIGRHFERLRASFHDEALVDMLCLLRVHAELAIRAKGLLVMKELGVEPELDADFRERLQEMQALEHSLGRAGLMAIRPLLAATGKDLWQLRLLA